MHYITIRYLTITITYKANLKGSNLKIRTQLFYVNTNKNKQLFLPLSSLLALTSLSLSYSLSFFSSASATTTRRLSTKQRSIIWFMSWLASQSCDPWPYPEDVGRSHLVGSSYITGKFARWIREIKLINSKVSAKRI